MRYWLFRRNLWQFPSTANYISSVLNTKRRKTKREREKQREILHRNKKSSLLGQLSNTKKADDTFSMTGLQAANSALEIFPSWPRSNLHEKVDIFNDRKCCIFKKGDLFSLK
jgi:hypothetical protein